MQRIDPPHEQPSRRLPVSTPTEAEVEALRQLLGSEDWRLADAVALVQASPGLERAVRRAVLSADMSVDRPVESTWHALAILGEVRLNRLVDRLQRELSDPVVLAASKSA